MKIKLLLANSDDEEFLFKLRNDPQNYRYFFENRPVTKEEHHAWFKNILSQSSLEPPHILLIGFAPKPIGMVRFDFNHEIPEISISILSKLHGKGFGKALLSAALSWPDPRLKIVKACVLTDNIRSKKLFLSCDFIERETVFIWKKK